MTGKTSESAVQRCYLGIDPGKEKTGLALVRDEGAVIAVKVVKTVGFAEATIRFIRETLQVSNTWSLRSRLAGIIIGNGTNSKKQRAVIEASFPGIPVYTVNEARSTEEARSLYWKLHPPSGWRRFLPLGLQIPPEPLDGLAAAVQVQRYLKNNG